MTSDITVNVMSYINVIFHIRGDQVFYQPLKRSVCVCKGVKRGLIPSVVVLCPYIKIAKKFK
jgi:hypothetical protein